MAKSSKKASSAPRKVSRRSGLPIEKISPKTDNQKIAMELMELRQVVVLEGLAGTGKTYMAIHHALTQLLTGKKEKIVITRPLTTVGNEKMGFLPGDVNDKVRPYAEQFIEYLSEFSPMMTMQDMDALQDQVEFIPVGYLRGRNFRNTVIIADEFQNSSLIQMKTLLTRIEDSSQLIIMGDMKQEDMQQVKGNGLADLIYRLNGVEQDHIGHVRFGVEDIQRGEFVKFIMRLYGEL